MHRRWPQHLLPTLPPSATRHQTSSDRIQQRRCDNTHDSIDKHVSEDAPAPQRPRKTCEQDLFASPAARASQGITIRRSPSVSHPRALREPSTASASGYPVGYPTCLESRYQAFIASRSRIKLFCLKRRLVQSPHATTIIIAFGSMCASVLASGVYYVNN